MFGLTGWYDLGARGMSPAAQSTQGKGNSSVKLSS